MPHVASFRVTAMETIVHQIRAHGRKRFRAKLRHCMTKKIRDCLTLIIIK